MSPLDHLVDDDPDRPPMEWPFGFAAEPYIYTDRFGPPLGAPHMSPLDPRRTLPLAGSLFVFSMVAAAWVGAKVAGHIYDRVTGGQS